MREHNSGNDREQRKYHSEPVFSVHDEIKRNRRIERNRRIRQARATGRRLFTVTLSVTVVLITLIAVLFTVMRVRTVTVSGNSRYTADEILSAAELDGSILPFASSGSVYKKIVAECPYVNSIELKKTYPSSVEIVVNEAEVVYCAEIHGRHYSLDKDLRVIEFTESSVGLITLKLPEVISAVEGNKLVFSDQRFEELIPTLLEELLSEDILPYTSLDLVNRFSITGIVDENTKIDFGDYNDIGLKIKAAAKLWEKSIEEQSSRTFINVSVLGGSGPSMILDFEGEF